MVNINKKLFWLLALFLIAVPLVNAVLYWETHGVVDDTSAGAIPYYSCLKHFVNVTGGTLKNVTRFAGETATKAYVTNQTPTDGQLLTPDWMVQSTFDANGNASFNLPLEQWRNYTICVGSDGSNHNDRRKNTGISFPYYGTITKFVNDWNYNAGTNQWSTTGTVIYGIKGLIIDFTTPNNNAFAFNGTSTPINNYEYLTNQSIIFSQNAQITNNTLNCSLILNGQSNFVGQYSSLTNVSTLFNINTTNYGVYGLNSYYFSCNSSITNTITTSSSTNFYIGGILNITAQTYNLTNITTFNASINGVTYGTTNGVISVGLDREQSLFIVFDTNGYEYKNTTLTFNSTFIKYNFSVYLQNTINITFYDAETNAIVPNVTAELISSVYANNYSTTNGKLFLELLSPTEYDIRYIGTQGYSRSNYIFNLVNRTYNEINLYLIKNTSTSVVTATTYDENNKLVEGAYIKSLKYDLTSNSYILQEIVSTNFEGKAQLNIKLNTEYYKFIIEKPSGTIVETTNPSYITSTSITFQINLQTPFATEFYRTHDTNGNLIFNPSTNAFRFTYSDSNNILTQGCLRVYSVTTKTETLYNTSCASSSSGTLLVSVANASGLTYRAKAYVTFTDNENLWGTLTKTFPEANLTGKEGLFWVFVLTLVFSMVGAWNVTIALILTPLPLFLGSILGLISLPFGISLMITAVLWWTAFTISSK